MEQKGLAAGEIAWLACEPRLDETETLELKRSTSELKEAIISISAILNKHQRGELYFGINNDGRVIGQDIGESTLRDVSRAISENIEPKIYPRITCASFDGIACIHVEFQGNDTPYYAYGRAYMRVWDEDRQLSAKELESLILSKNKDKLRWDMQACEKAKPKDISPKKLKLFLKASGLKYCGIRNSLEKLGLLSNGKPLNAAVILFGKKPRSFFQNAKLRCAVFGTTDTSFTIDMQDFEGDLFYLIERAEEYILKNIHIGMRLDGLRRVDVPEIDKEAVREAVINAFCHRDYYEYDSVNIAVFKDRVEIRNPGGLYGGLTLDKIIRENLSKRRNELIAELFNKIHFVEKWGRGIELILSKEPETAFKEIAGMFVAVFRRKNITGLQGVEKGVEKGVENLSENEMTLIELMRKNPSISKREMREKTGFGKKAIDRNISRLKNKGIVKRAGPDKGGHWETVQDSETGHK